MATPAELLVARGRVPDEFDRIAARYDLLASLSPFYRRDLRLSAARLHVPAGGLIVDVCAGTGLSTVALVAEHATAWIVALDRSAGMLGRAVRRLGKASGRAGLVRADAMNLPFAEASVDAVLMAYGIRNVPDADACLRGLYRILKPGGHVAFHEYSVRDSATATRAWKAMSTTAIIPAGRVLAGTADIFRYLRASVLEFDGVAGFSARLRNAGFVGVDVRPMPGLQRGITHTFLAARPVC